MCEWHFRITRDGNGGLRAVVDSLEKLENMEASVGREPERVHTNLMKRELSFMSSTPKDKQQKNLDMYLKYLKPIWENI